MKDQKRMLIPDNSWDAGIMESWLEDMARWTTYPEDWPDMAQAGVEEAMARRPAQLGNTNESLARYRDEMLLEILKLHHKL